MYILQSDIQLFIILMTYCYLRIKNRRRIARTQAKRYSIKANVTHQLQHTDYMVNFSDETCKDNLRMNRDYFNRLCFLLQNIDGLSPTRHVIIAE